ncbi:MAG TPA: heat-inducible transcription repressor HrcA [Dehalococcoidia bacterium]|nr:heat-inducible transcription repressor HrcA [Dehalococcoidia bacterium]
MSVGLIARREAILKIIVGEYIATAVPVASETIFRSYRLGVSPATIRNDMAYLEEEGYITRPYTSAGSVPLDKGYRYYVESLAGDIKLSVDEQHHIRNLFYEVEEEFERWLKLGAVLVSRIVRNAALVTFPKASQCRFKHLELVSVHEFLTLLVLVLSEAILKRQLLSFDEPVTQEQLTGLASKLNVIYSGLTGSEISARKLELSAEEERVTEAVVDIMAAEDEMEYDEPYLEGLRLMLGQPEFVEKDRMLGIMELMEAKDWLRPVLFQRSGGEGVQVVIGEENQDEALRDLSLVFSRYGIPHKVGGTIVVIGPTRMDYRRAISAVGCVSEVLSDLVSGVCRGD